jgi:hypothetical protein
MDFFVRQGAHHSDSRRYRADVQRRMAARRPHKKTRFYAYSVAK